MFSFLSFFSYPEVRKVSGDIISRKRKKDVTMPLKWYRKECNCVLCDGVYKSMHNCAINHIFGRRKRLSKILANCSCIENGV
jgi:hypothetical protein